MPKSLSSTQQERIEIHLESGLHPKAIAKVENVSARTVERYKANLKTWRSITAPLMKSRGRPTTIHLASQAGLLAYLKAKPWAYQDEMSLSLFDDWGILPTQSTISRTLARMKISRQVLKKEAMERSQLIHNDYMLRISEYSANQLVFLDESAANEHTLYRKFGWSAYGILPKASRPVKRSERWSILPAYSLNGVLATQIH